MPKCELITDACKAIVAGNIEQALAEEDVTGGKGINTQPPVEYFTREIEESLMVNYPACKIAYLRFQKIEEYTWRHYINVEIYHVNHDQDELEAQIKRLASAAQKVLEKELYWAGYGHDPRVTDGFISNVLPVESGFLRACRLQFNVETIEEGY